MDLYLHTFAFMTCTGTILPLYASILLDSKVLLKIFVTDDNLLEYFQIQKIMLLGRQSKINHAPASRSVASIEVQYLVHVLKDIHSYTDRLSVAGIWKIKGHIATFICVNFK